MSSPLGARAYDARRLQRLLCAELQGRRFARREVSFLLGTDAFIHRERRVAMTPRHVARLRRDLEALGLEPRLHAAAGAGERAQDASGRAFADDAYRDAGARVVSVEEAAALEEVDVVHALKEPTDYESRLPGPLLRIGALHLASRPPGLCRMLAARNFAAILDGGTVGNCSYLKYGGDRTPIVGSMSRFAGAVAGRKLVEGVTSAGLEPGRVIVVGGGIAGQSAISKLRPVARELVVVEAYAPVRERLGGILQAMGFTAAVGERTFRVVERLEPEILDDAVGIVFAHRSGARAAERVCHERDVFRMRPGAAVADIAIDQGGSIDHDELSPEDDAVACRDKTRRRLEGRYTYYAETNMPREEPREASVTHGDASLPYVTALLALCALEGGTRAAVRRILENEVVQVQDPARVADRTLLDCVVQDLRNGLQLAATPAGVEITDPDVAADPALAGWVHDCAAG